MDTEADILTNLSIVSQAIKDLVAGVRRTKLEINTGGVKRVYEYGTTTLDDLTKLKDDLQYQLNLVQNSSAATGLNFYNNSIPLIRNFKL
jgi:hypothetical protein